MKKRNNRYKLILKALFLAWCLPYSLCAQQLKQPFKGHFHDEKEDIHLQLNLYERNLQVPDMDFVGEVNGYMHGNIYGIWLLTKFKIEDNVATLRMSHDSGADSQTIELTVVNDSTLSYRALNGNAVRKINKRKLVKIPGELKFTRKK